MGRPEVFLPAPRHTECPPAWTHESEHAQLAFFPSELLEVKFRARTELTVETVTELLKLADARLDRPVKYLLVDICGLDRVDADVPCLFNPVTEGMRIALLGAGPTDRVLARFFMRKIDPLRRFTYVESRQDALAFLLEND